MSSHESKASAVEEATEKVRSIDRSKPFTLTLTLAHRKALSALRNELEAAASLRAAEIEKEHNRVLDDLNTQLEVVMEARLQAEEAKLKAEQKAEEAAEALACSLNCQKSGPSAMKQDTVRTVAATPEAGLEEASQESRITRLVMALDSSGNGTLEVDEVKELFSRLLDLPTAEIPDDHHEARMNPELILFPNLSLQHRLQLISLTVTLIEGGCLYWYDNPRHVDLARSEGG